MKPRRWIISILIVFLFYNVHGEEEEEEEEDGFICPYNAISNTECVENKCSSDSDVCMKIELITELQTKYWLPYCCSMKIPFCQSRMISFLPMGDKGHETQWKFVTDSLKPYYYKETIVHDKAYVPFACPIPISFEFYVPGFPNQIAVSFTEEQPIFTKRCTKSSDCTSDDQRRRFFCGYAGNPSFNHNTSAEHLYTRGLDRSDNGKAFKFCFRDPYEWPYVTLRNSDVGLTLCDTTAECVSLFPDVADGDVICDTRRKFNRVLGDGENPGPVANGVCVTAYVCNALDETTAFGSIGTSGEQCDPERAEETCAQTGFATRYVKPENSTIVVQSYCMEEWQHPINQKTFNYCCYKFVDPCTLPNSIVDEPAQSCESFADCVPSWEPVEVALQSFENERFCDPQRKLCCKVNLHPKNTVLTHQCPDKATVWGNETKCENYDETKIDSGKCPTNDKYLCKYGHCCPETVWKEGEPHKFPSTFYVSNMECDPQLDITEKTPGGYCEPDREVIVFMGTHDLNGEVVSLGMNCTSNEFCDYNEDGVCVWLNDGGHCYRLPQFEKEPELSFHRKRRVAPMPTSMLIVYILCAILYVATCIGVCLGWYFLGKQVEKFNELWALENAAAAAKNADPGKISDLGSQTTTPVTTGGKASTTVSKTTTTGDKKAGKKDKKKKEPKSKEPKSKDQKLKEKKLKEEKSKEEKLKKKKLKEEKSKEEKLKKKKLKEEKSKEQKSKDKKGKKEPKSKAPKTPMKSKSNEKTMAKTQNDGGASANSQKLYY